MVTTIAAGCSEPVEPDAAVDAGADAGAQRCTRDTDCGDPAAFCTQWRCEPDMAGADARGCVDLGGPCEAGIACDEALDVCAVAPWCTEGRDGCVSPADCDGDGAHSLLECGGDDCDDSDPERFPGNVEVCDADNRDEDCDPMTFASGEEHDVDGDGFVVPTCCNGDACGADCDDLRVSVHPDAREICNGLDDDCDGTIDEAGALCPQGACVEARCHEPGWQRLFPHGNDRNQALAVDGSANAYFAITNGQPFDPPVDIDGDGAAEPAGDYLVSIDPAGALRWFVESPEPVALLMDGASGRLLSVEAHTIRWIDPATGAVERTASVPDEPEAEDDPVVAAAWFGRSLYVGRNLSDGDANRRVLLQRLDADGREVAARLVAVDWPESWTIFPAFDLAVSVAGVAFTGATASEVSLGESASGAEVRADGDFVALLDHDLRPIWSVSGLPESEDGEDNLPAALAVSSTGEVVVVGGYEVAYSPPGGAPWPVGGRSDSYLLLFDSSGEYRWGWAHHGPRSESMDVVDFDGRAGLIAAGTFSGTLETGPFTGSPQGNTDGVALRFDVETGAALRGWQFSGNDAQAILGLATDGFGAFVVTGHSPRQVVVPGGVVLDTEDGLLEKWAVRITE